MFLFKKIGLIY